MTPELELLGVILQVFPSFQALTAAEQAARTEALGLFLAQGWNVGASRLRQHGLEVTPEIVSGLAPAALRVTQARRGGATFLVHLRQAVNDEAQFARIALALGALYARSRPPSSATGSATRGDRGAGSPPSSESGRFQVMTAEPRASAQSGRFAIVPPDQPAAPPVAKPTIVPPPAAAKATSSRPAFNLDDGSDLDELDLSANRQSSASAAAKDIGETTGGFDARMLADLERTLKETGKHPAVPASLMRALPVAPAPAPAAPAAPQPGQKGWTAFEQAVAQGGAVFKDEGEPKAPPSSSESKRVKLPGLPATPGLRPEAPKEGALELVPEDPKKDSGADITDRILTDLKARDEEKAAEPVQKRPSARLKSTNVRVQEFSLDTNDDWANVSAEEEAKEEDASSEEELPKDPAQASIVKYERTGDPKELAEASRIFQETVASAPHGTARAFAEAGLAKVYLLIGNAPKADQQARAALERDPGNPFAVEIIVRVMRGEADRSRLAAGLAQARTLLAQGRAADARKLLETKVAAEYPDAPQPWLLAAWAAKIEQDDAQFEANVAQAWQRYPAKKAADLPLGGTIDVDLAQVMAMHGRVRFKTLDPNFLSRTVEDVDSRDNLVAGMFRLAIAIARVGIARSHLSRRAIRKGWTAIGSALIGLQYYDAAVEAFDRAASLRPEESETKQLDSERRLAGQMRRAFDKPGVKAQLGKYACLGAQVLSAATRDRLAAAGRDKAERQGELMKAADEVAKLVACDSRVRDEVRHAAVAMKKPIDPTEALAVADAELASVRDERARLADPAKAAPQAKGLLGKIASAASAAADKVASTAKDAQLKVREMQILARREEAVRKLGLSIARDLREHAWLTSQLKAFARRAASLEAFADYHGEEERLAKAELDALAKSV